MSTDTSLDHDEGLVTAVRFATGETGTTAAQLDWAALGAGAAPEDGFLWVHLDRAGQRTEPWLTSESGLERPVIEALLAEETRPRATPLGDGVILNLRGVNLNPGADPEDMVSIRIYLEPRRIISVRLRKLMAIRELRDEIARGKGPESPGNFIGRLALGLAERMGPVIHDLIDSLDKLENRVARGNIQRMAPALRRRLIDERRTAMTLRRYIAPQRDALSGLLTLRLDGFGDGDKLLIREAVDQITRHVEDLDLVRERASVVQEELQTRLSELSNERLYVLSIVTAVFLPLSFLTGLLGINVGGIPGTDNNLAFLGVIGLLAAFGALEVLILKMLRWF